MLTGRFVSSQETRDGAYDGTPTSNLLVNRFGEDTEIVIPPPITAVPSPECEHDPSFRDKHIAAIRNKARMVWQFSSGYNQRSRGETQMDRWKTVIGPKLKARNFPNQITEVWVGTNTLNKMAELGRPEYEAIVWPKLRVRAGSSLYLIRETRLKKSICAMTAVPWMHHPENLQRIQVRCNL